MFLEWLRGLFSGGPVYVGIGKRELILRNSRTGESLRLAARIAVNPESKRISAAGNDGVIQMGDHVHWPFDHPRLVVADFILAQKLLQHAVRKLFGNRWLRPAPVLVMHSLETWEGGVTEIEWRVFRELAHGAGARQVHLWQGTPPSDNSLRSSAFLRSSQLVKS